MDGSLKPYMINFFLVAEPAYNIFDGTIGQPGALSTKGNVFGGDGNGACVAG
jgi:hypothetical protein